MSECKSRDETINIPLDVRNYHFIKKEFNIDILRAIDALKTMPPIVIEQVLNHEINAAIYKLKAEIFVDRKSESKIIDFKYPKNWWQHLKYDIIKSGPGWLKKLFRLKMNNVKMKAKQWNIEFIKDYFPDSPEWHREVSYQSRSGGSPNILYVVHEEIWINEAK